jgi:hypothetical protein
MHDISDWYDMKLPDYSVIRQFFIEILDKSNYSSILRELMGTFPILTMHGNSLSGVCLFSVLLMNHIKL